MSGVSKHVKRAAYLTLPMFSASAAASATSAFQPHWRMRPFLFLFLFLMKMLWSRLLASRRRVAQGGAVRVLRIGRMHTGALAVVVCQREVQPHVQCRGARPAASWPGSHVDAGPHGRCLHGEGEGTQRSLQGTKGARLLHWVAAIVLLASSGSVV